MINGKVYVGSAINYKLRWNNHESNLKYNRHPNSYLQAAWNKDGGTNFEFAAIEMVKDKKELVGREQFWIDNLKACDREYGYNLRKIATSNAGMVWSEEVRLKISNSMRGKKRSLESIEKSRLKRIGQKRTKEQKEAQSLKIKGRKTSDATKRLLSIVNRNTNKWPCADASGCRCNVCKAKRAKIAREMRYYKAARVKMLAIAALSESKIDEEQINDQGEAVVVVTFPVEWFEKMREALKL